VDLRFGVNLSGTHPEDTLTMPSAKGPKKDQKKRSAGTSRTGKTNQYRPKKRGSIGSSKPGGDGPGTKKWTRA